MNTFTNAIGKNVNTTTTTNGMTAFSKTGSVLLDLFSEMGNYRERIDTKLVHSAYSDNPLYFARLLFFNRNVRGGQKVKRTLQYVLQNIDSFPKIKQFLQNNLEVIPHFGYWKDLYNLRNTTLWNDAIAFWCKQLVDDNTALTLAKQDGKNVSISLAAKFAPSERNGANDANRIMAKEFAAYMNISPKQYRLMISALRKHLNIVERLMSEKRWDDIDFSTVPSIASKLYRKAFERNAKWAFEAWVNDSTRKVNVTGITPVDIVANFSTYSNLPDAFKIKQWNNLPDMNISWNIFPVIDCSGSMGTNVGKGIRAIDVSHALGLYFAHRLKGPYKNLLIEFSRTAKYIQLSGDFYDDLKRVRRLSEVANTNLESVFDLILKTAKQSNVLPADMPTHLLIVSDMQFDQATTKGHTAIQTMTKKYNANGYALPHVIFWNVTQRQAKPIYNDDKGATLLSGWSPDILNYLFTGEYNPHEQINLTPYEQMLKVIEHEDYSMINW
jgi:hypothetical protein